MNALCKFQLDAEMKSWWWYSIFILVAYDNAEQYVTVGFWYVADAVLLVYGTWEHLHEILTDIYNWWLLHPLLYVT